MRNDGFQRMNTWVRVRVFSDYHVRRILGGAHKTARARSPRKLELHEVIAKLKARKPTGQA